MTREPIYTALLAFTSGLTFAQKFASASRVWRPHTDFSIAAQLPVLLHDERPEKAMVAEFGAHPVFTLPVDVWVYMLAPQVSQTPGRETTIPQSPLNAAIDVLTNAFNPNPQGRYPTLGGLVQWARLEGSVQKVAGVGSGNLLYSIARVPIVMRYVDPT